MTVNTGGYYPLEWILTTKDGAKYVFYNNGGKIKYISDRYGNTTQFLRTPFLIGNLTTVVSPNGKSIELLYTGSLVTAARDSSGRTWTYTYNGRRMTSATDPMGGTWQYTYDSYVYDYPNMLTVVDPRGNTVVTNEFDFTRVKKQTYADGSTISFAWTLNPDATIQQVDVTDQRDNVRRVVFNPTYYISSNTFALGKPEIQTTTYSRDPTTNLLLSSTDPLSRVTSFTYDAKGNVLTRTQLSGTSNAVTTTYTYEPTFNRVTTITDPLGHVTSYTYDSQGNATQIADANNNSRTMTYTPQGQIATMTDALMHTKSFGYDAGILTSITDALGRTTSRSPDALGRIIAVRDPLGNVLQASYDALDQVTTVTDPIGSPVQFVYDPNGNLLSHTDPRGNSTVYTYDAMNRVATKRDALLNVESYTHDVSSMLSQVYDRKGQVSGMAYDAMNRRVSIGFGGTVGNPTNFDSTITYTFDGGNRVLQAADTQNGNVLRSYDGLDRLIQEQTPQGIVSYTYDSGGRRLTMTVAGQSMVTYAYDNANRLLQIQQGTQNVTFAYDAANRRTQTVLPNAVAINYAYDNATELTAITYTKGATTLGDLSYTYDAAGQRVSVGGSFARTNLPPAIAPTSYNANSQLTQWGAQTLTYDLDGNLTSDGTYTYFWNSRNQAAQVRQGATIVADYHYDAFGRRMQKTINGVTTQFLFDGHNLVQELSGGGAVTANLLSGLGIDEVYTRTKSGTTASFLIDHLGTIIAETDTAGTLQTSYTYEPYGRTTQSGSPSDNSQRYTSREQDLDNLYYYRARYYATATDRFISEDPNGLGAGATFYTSYRGYDPRGMISSIGFMNSYAYASDNPEMFVDPLGLVPSKSGGDAAKSYGDQCLRLAKFQLESGKCPDDGACLFCCLHFMEAKFPHPLIIMCEELCSKGLELYKQGKKFKCAGCQ